MPDERKEMLSICRISYAVSRKWISKSFEQIQELIGEEKCNDEDAVLNYHELVSIIGEKEFKDVTNRIFHDAVEAVARIWLKAWNDFINP